MSKCSEQFQAFLASFDKGESNPELYNKYKQDLGTIITCFRETSPDEADFVKANLEHEVFNFHLSVSKGIQPFQSTGSMVGKKQIITFKWPNIDNYSAKEFDYIFTRFKTTANLFAKRQYGLLLYLAKQKADDGFVLEVFDTMTKLYQTYLKGALSTDKKTAATYGSFFIQTLYDCFDLIQSRRASAHFQKQFASVQEYIFDLALNSKKENISRLLFSLTKFINDNFSDFKQFDIKALLNENWTTIKELQKDRLQNAVDFAENTLKLSDKSGQDSTDLHRFISDSYIILAKERGGIVAPEFFIRSYKHSKSAKDDAKCKEIENLYNEAKKQLGLAPFSYELPAETRDEILESFEKEIAEKSSEEIALILALGLILPRFSSIKENALKSNDFAFSKILATSVFDGYGNKSTTIGAEDEDEDVTFYDTYGLMLQIPTKLYFRYFFRAVTEKKITLVALLKILKKSWYGKTINRDYSDHTRPVVILDLLTSPLKLLFTEFENKIKDENYNVDLVCILDSLTLKVEYIIRIIFSELGLPTTYFKKDSTIEEKTFTALVKDLKKHIKDHKHLDPKIQQDLLDDIIFIDFVMNSKAGKNIRNEIAHGHVNYGEYSPLDLGLVLAVILRLSLWNIAKVQKAQADTSKK